MSGRTYVALEDLDVDQLEVACTRCARAGRYAVARLIAAHGAGKSLVELREVFAGDCPLWRPAIYAEQCGMIYPQLGRPPAPVWPG